MPGAASRAAAAPVVQNALAPPASLQLKPLASYMNHPDPRTRPNLLHLGTLQFPFTVQMSALLALSTSQLPLHHEHLTAHPAIAVLLQGA